MLGEVIARPCFTSLTHAGRLTRGTFDHFEPAASSVVEKHLMDSESDAVILESGLGGEMVAGASLATGRTLISADEPKPPLSSYVVVPHVAANLDALVDAYCAMATALEAIAGYIAVEADFERGQRAGMAMQLNKRDTRANPGIAARRNAERLAHSHYSQRLDRELSGPEWALILGPSHLAKMPANAWALFTSTVDLASLGQLALLTQEPGDALWPDAEELFGRARLALAPLLMDVSALHRT